MPITPCKAKRGLADPAGSSFVDGGIGNFPDIAHRSLFS
jgi:hypothetical protein